MAERIELDVVRGWLDDQRLEYDAVEPPTEDGRKHLWALAVSATFNTLVTQVDAPYNHLTMQVRISVSKAHLETLAAVEVDDRDRFLYDFQITMHQQPIGFALEVAEERKVVQGFIVGINLLEEEIQRAGFFRRLHQIQSAAAVGAKMLQKLHRFQAWP